MMLAILLTVLVAIGWWRQDAVTALAWATDGFLDSASVLSVVFGSILVMNTLKHSGALAAIQRGFNGVTPDRRIQTIIVGYAFAAFVEGAAGFGSSAERVRQGDSAALEPLSPGARRGGAQGGGQGGGAKARGRGAVVPGESGRRTSGQAGIGA